MKSTLIFNDFTCVDHAYVSPIGTLIGGSFLLSVILTGEVQSGEEVVIDFSAGKKKLKAAIDDHANGFDHKLWICRDSTASLSFKPLEDNVTVTTPNMVLNLTENSVRIVDGKYSDVASLEAEFETYLNNVLNDGSDATLKYETKCILSIKPAALSDTGVVTFRYAHGLPNSSSYGCQNIAHGHLSYFMLLGADYKALPLSAYQEGDYADSLTALAFELDSTYFAARQNVKSTGVGIEVCYTSPRGKFHANFKNEYKVVILDIDTTIEHVIEYIKPKFESFKEIGAKYLLVSEGLAKGAITEL